MAIAGQPSLVRDIGREAEPQVFDWLDNVFWKKTANMQPYLRRVPFLLRLLLVLSCPFHGQNCKYKV